MSSQELLGAEVSQLDTVSQVWKSVLYAPLEDFLARPRKDFRGELVHIGFSLCLQNEKTIEQAMALPVLSEILEWIHSGSLIIDDIQDNSLERRGSPAVHRLYGVPIALNVGNWMYFKALEKIHQVQLPSETRLRILECTHNVMAKAHQGQALDLGANLLEIPQQEVAQVVDSSHLLKSGALVSLALQLGALVANATDQLEPLDHLGAELGASLQRFDDIGNVRFGRVDAKDLEDLKLRRPSWIWRFLSEECSSAEWNEFKEAVRCLPDENRLQRFFEKNNFKHKAHLRALVLHQDVQKKFKRSFASSNNSEALDRLMLLTEKIAHAYK